MLDKGWLPAQRLVDLAISPWIEKIPIDTARTFLDRMMPTAPQDTPDPAMRFLYWYVKRHPEFKAQTAEWAWRLLGNPWLQRDYIWEELATIYMEDYPVQVAEALIQQIPTEHFGYIDDRGLNILDQLMRIAAPTVWPVLGNALLEGRIWYPRNGLYNERQDTFRIEKLNTTYLMEWAASHQPRGPRVLASLVEIEASIPDLARALLRQYSKDEEVRQLLSAGFLGGIIDGNIATWRKAKLRLARNWLEDRDSSVQGWARGIVDSLEQDLAQHEEDDTFEDYNLISG